MRDSQALPTLIAILTAVTVAVAAALLLTGPVRAPLSGDSAARVAAEIAALPGRGADAPVIAAPVLPADDARARNAAISFVGGPITPAAPFRFAGSVDDRRNAVDCLALAAMAEAGPSDIGQRAVIQVILNRVRHPAFPTTVCGVVFEGSQRRTGCQFSFTCDGSLARQYGAGAWEAARLRAANALGGYVMPEVGLATHYHTDWVFPYWSPKLEKLARVETHLFFRWPGYWGSARAARSVYRGGEPALAALTAPDPAASLAATDPAATTAALPPPPTAAPPIDSGRVVMRDPSGKANFMLLDGADPAAALQAARQLCTAAGTCRVLGWSDPAAIPAALPLPRPSRAQLQFSYTRDPAGAEIVLYGCGLFKGIDRDKCIPRAR